MLIMAKKLWKEEDGLGTLEILLIVAVLVAVAIVFRKQIINWVTEIFSETDDQIQNRNDLEVNF